MIALQRNYTSGLMCIGRGMLTIWSSTSVECTPAFELNLTLQMNCEEDASKQ